MYVVVNHLHLDIPVDELRAAVEQEGAPLLSQLPGFRGFYFVRNGERDATVIIHWESAEAADNGARSFGPTWFAKNIAPHLASEQQRSGGEAIVQRQA